MILSKKIKPKNINIAEICGALNSLVMEKDKNFFAFDSVEFETEISKIVAPTDLSPEFLDNLKIIASEAPSWKESPERWSLLLRYLSDCLEAEEKNAAQGEGEEEESEDDDVAPPDDVEDEEESDGGNGIISKIRDEFSEKQAMDEFFIKKLPHLPIIGTPFLAILLYHRIIVYLWDKFIDLIDFIAKTLNIGNSIISAARFLSGRNVVFRLFIRSLATLLAYGHWLWYIILWPILRWLTDPIGRTIRFFESRFAPNEQQQTDDPASEEPDP